MSFPDAAHQGINIQSPPYNLPISTAASKIFTNLVPSPLSLWFLIYTLADLSAVTSAAIPEVKPPSNKTTLPVVATFFLPNPVVSEIPVSVPAV